MTSIQSSSGTSTATTLRSRRKPNPSSSATERSSSTSNLPSSRLPRTPTKYNRTSSTTTHSPTQPTSLQSLFPTPPALQNSWSKLQSLASDLLSLNEPTQTQTNGTGSAQGKRLGLVRNSSDSVVNTMLAKGRRSRREELVCRKLEEDADAWMKGRGGDEEYWRKKDSDIEDSDGEEAAKRKRMEEQRDRESLVYVHHVKPTDTLEGLVLIYNISAHALRKANRLWMNDSVQTRKIIFLPVAECLVKGRTLSPEESAKLPKEGGESDGREYTHENWIHFPTMSSPVEIGRLQTSALSHFPPRRKAASARASTEIPSLSVAPPDSPRSLRPPIPGFEPGVHSMHPERDADLGVDVRKVVDGVEKVGNVVESFLRNLSKKTGEVVEGELIELTQSLGLRDPGPRAEEGRRGRMVNGDAAPSEASASSRQSVNARVRKKGTPAGSMKGD